MTQLKKRQDCDNLSILSGTGAHQGWERRHTVPQQLGDEGCAAGRVYERWNVGKKDVGNEEREGEGDFNIRKDHLSMV